VHEKLGKKSGSPFCVATDAVDEAKGSRIDLEIAQALKYAIELFLSGVVFSC
jgi:hypothetical protein